MSELEKLLESTRHRIKEHTETITVAQAKREELYGVLHAIENCIDREKKAQN